MKVIHYRDEQLMQISLRVSSKILDTMRIMNEYGLRLVPVLEDDSDKLYGVVSDGDIRRYLTQNGNLNEYLGKLVNTEPKILTSEVYDSEIRTAMLSMGVEFLPVVVDDKLVAFHASFPAVVKEGTTAVIMAGGLGSRLAPLTDNCPKPMLTLNDKPMLTHIIDELKSRGIFKYIICINYLGEQIMNYYGDGSRLGIEITYIQEQKRLGTGGALSLINPEILSEPFLCFNADTINDVDISNLLERHENAGWQATMVVCDHNYNVPYGVVRYDEEGRYLSSEEKPIIKFKINAGMYMLSKDVLSSVPKDVFYDLPSLFEDLRTKNVATGIYTHTGRWIDIGNVSEYERAKKIFESDGQF